MKEWTEMVNGEAEGEKGVEEERRREEKRRENEGKFRSHSSFQKSAPMGPV